MDINNERSVRLSKLSDIQSAGIDPYPARVARTHTCQEALDTDHETQVTVAGRILIKRDLGKVAFCQLSDATGSIQIVLKKDEIDEDQFKLFLKKIDAGDIVSVTGDRIVTQTGEESVAVQEWHVLAKSLLPLPDKFHGLQDEETKLRKRYLDMLVNPTLRDRLETRARVIRFVRDFLHKNGFIEFETPMLETVAAGAMARTFDTHLNAYDLPVHLRIAVGELWQKRLLVGGFEKTFEIGKAFRNEGVSFQHNPEFTMLEYYWAYADMFDNIALHEEFFEQLVQEITGGTTITIGDVDVSFKGPYERVYFHDVVLEQSGIDINEYDDVESLAAAMKKAGYETEDITERGKLIDHLYKQAVRPNIVQPTFVMNYPVELKPLAKRSEDPRYTEMFQLLVNGVEVTNSYTELNDPVDQRVRFEEQARNKAAGDDEAMENDWDYVEAMEHGMPPATGTGIGIDRLVMFLTGAETIRDVIAFPMVKPKLDTISKSGDMKNTVASHPPATEHDLPISRDEAWKLVQEYNSTPSDLYHYLESEAVCRAIARRVGLDEEYLGMLGLLHDIDWGLTKEAPETHLTKMPDMLRTAGFDEQFIEDVLSHGYGTSCAGLESKKRTRPVEFALAAGETVTGLIHAASLMREDKIATLTVKSLKKKYKNKKFAAGVHREIIDEHVQLGLSQEEFFQLAIDAIRDIADQVELV